MKLNLLPSLFLTVIAIPTASAATTLTSGHADIGIGYDGAFDLHVHDDETDTEYAPDEVILGVGSAALQFSPGGAFSFLGPAGTPVWVLPKEQNPELLFLGLGTEELDPADWTGNIGLTLTAVSGPGTFYLWDVNSFGVPTVSMNSGDGITAGDTVSLVPGSHAHYNLGFSAPGTYSVSFEATGLHVVDGFQNSGPAAYTFQVVPEPGSVVLAIVGAGAVLWYSRRRS
jgi:surface-anchored protein